MVTPGASWGPSVLTRRCVSDREGHLVSEADQLALRSGRQPVRLVRKHGEDHEGTGLPDGKRHLYKVSSHWSLSPQNMRITVWPELTWRLLPLQLLRQPEENIRNQPQTPPHQADARKSQRKPEPPSKSGPCSFICILTANVSFSRRMQRTRRQKIWPWSCLRRRR